MVINKKLTSKLFSFSRIRWYNIPSTIINFDEVTIINYNMFTNLEGQRNILLDIAKEDKLIFIIFA